MENMLCMFGWNMCTHFTGTEFRYDLVLLLILISDQCTRFRPLRIDGREAGRDVYFVGVVFVLM